MPSFIVFNGITRYAPGGITRLNADALAPVVLGQNSVVALLGEADGGEPGVLISLDDSSRIRRTFRSGALADAINIAFKPANDPFIPGGASQVVCYKTNESTQSTVTLPGPEAQVVLSSEATGGTGSTLDDSTLIPTTRADQYVDMWLVLRPRTITQEIKPVVNYDELTGTFSVGSAWTANPVAGDEYEILSNSVVMVGEVSTGATTTTIPVLNANFEVDEHADRWVVLYPEVGATQKRRIVSNTATTLTVSPAFSSAPIADTTWLQILPKAVVLTSRDWGLHTNSITADIATSATGGKIATTSFEGNDEISPEIGGFAFFKVLFKGAATSNLLTTLGVSTETVLRFGPSVPSIVDGELAGQYLTVNGESTFIVGNVGFEIFVSPPLSEPPETGSEIHVFEGSATGHIEGAAGKALRLVTTTGVPGADLDIAFAAGMTLRQLMDAVNATTIYQADVPAGVNPDTNFAVDFDFGDTTKIDIMVSPELTDVGFKQDASQLVKYYNSVSELVTAERASDGDFDGALTAGDTEDPLVLSGGSRGVSTNTSFQLGFDALLGVRVQHVTPLIDEDLVNEGFGSTATVASVAAQLKDHVKLARGAIGSERGGYIGFEGTKKAIRQQASALNDMDVALLCQRPTLLDLGGNLTEFGPRMLAVTAAGCRAGCGEIGEPLTNKILNTASLTNDDSWDPKDLTDANDMIRSGILFAAPDDTNTIKWVRDLTSWTATDNLAFSEGSIRDVCRFIAYNLRKVIVDRYTGRKGTVTTIRNVRNTAASYMEQCRTDNLIVDSTDPGTGVTTYAFHSLKVTSSGDTVRISVGFFPVPGLNFFLFDLTVGIATQSV